MGASTVVLTAAALCLPYLRRGTPLINDASAHVLYLHEFSAAFWHGDLYPRWMPTINKGYGSPFFLLQYPLPFWVNALLRPVVAAVASTPSQEAHELGVYFFLSLASAGLAALVWLQGRHGLFAATLGALVYISLPYILAIVIFNDGAVGQLTAYVWMPLALAACDALRWKSAWVFLIAIALALLMLSNLLSAVLFAPFLFGYAIACGTRNGMNAAKSVASVMLSLTIGTCIAAIYILPLVWFRNLFDIGALSRHLPGMLFSSNFAVVDLDSLRNPAVFAGLATAMILVSLAMARLRRIEDRMVWLVMFGAFGFGILMIVPELGPAISRLSGLPTSPYQNADFFPAKMFAVVLSTLALGVYAYCAIYKEDRRKDERLTALAITACAAFVLMLPVSAPFWRMVPGLTEAVQFPYRLGAVVNLAVTGLFAAALDSGGSPGGSRGIIWLRMNVLLMAAVVIGAGIVTFRTDRRWVTVLRQPFSYQLAIDEGAQVDQWFRAYVPKDRLVRVASLIGAQVDGYQVQRTRVEPLNAHLLRGNGVVTVARKRSGTLAISYSLPAGGTALISQLYFPLWKVEFADGSGGQARIHTSEEGLLQVEFAGGEGEFDLVFDGGWPERCGRIISCLALVAAAGGLFLSRRPTNWEGQLQRRNSARISRVVST
jgi:hypothetical protein